MLSDVKSPIVMETHGGAGKVFRACYPDIQRGIVFEKDPQKAELLCRQRPSWSVYEADCVGALRAGFGAHLEINVLDVDPYGEPWSVIDAFLQSTRPKAKTLHIVVNDGLRQKIMMGGAWNTHILKDVVSVYGNNLYECYLEVCRYLMEVKAATSGYEVSRFVGYHCGNNGQMTHYLARLDR